MKKRMGFVILLAVFACCAGALAEMGTQLSPDAAMVFQDARWEGYTPVVVSGFGDGASQRGQYAVIMKKGDHNVLCMVEKEPGQSTFAITVETDKAVYQGDVLPSLLIDTGGDVLFYTYHAMYSQSQHYHTVKREDGTWSPVDLICMEIGADGGREMHFWLSDGRLHYQELRTDANDNVISRETEASIPVDETQYLLAQFDIDGFRQQFRMIEEVVFSASAGYGTLEELPADVRAALPADERLLQGALDQNTVLLLTASADGTSRIWIFDKVGETYALNCQSRPMPKIGETVPMTEMFKGDSFGLTYAPGTTLGPWVSKQRDGVWRITHFDVPNSVLVNGLWMYGFQEHWRLPGDLSAFELRNFDWTRIPQNKEELLALVNTDGFAMVKSDKATDRLNLRGEPSRDAVSYGKYYSGTPVRVLETKGDWCKVTVGGATGYMQRQYLAFGLDMVDVPCYFPQKTTYPAEFVLGIPMYERPNVTSANTVMPGDFNIIAAVGDDWYHVLCEDGTSGYVEVRHFWDGNG